jgi:hypothetical protein
VRRELEERIEGNRLHPTGKKRAVQSASSVIVEGFDLRIAKRRTVAFVLRSRLLHLVLWPCEDD